MSDRIFTLEDIRQIIKPLAEKYHISEVFLFGSYARNEATSSSDIDLLVFGGNDFKLVNILAFAEELRAVFNKNVDAFEICELDKGTDFYNTVMKERVKVA